MTDWNKVAEGLDAGIPAAQLDAIRPTLTALETTFRPMVATLAPDDDSATPFAPDIEAAG